MLERFAGVVLNLDIKQTAPVVAPYEAALAGLLAEFGRTDDVIVASFLDPATDAFRPSRRTWRCRPARWRRPSSGGRCRRARCRRSRPVAFQVPERYGELVVVDERFVEAAHRAGMAVHVWTVNDREHGAAGRPRGGRDHLRPTDDAGRRAGAAASPGGSWDGGARGPERTEGQPRPQFGFLPWLAFFFALSLRFTVRFDIRRTA